MSTPSTPREGGAAPPTLYRHRFANADYDEATCELKVDGQVVAIEPRPLRLLAELLRHVNEAVTKEELLDAVWESRITVDNVLTNAVNKLRTALGKAASAHIVSLPRVGYRLVGPVERTVVGQPDLLPLALRAGQPVPGREAFVLQRTLGSGGRGNVWLAQQAALAQGASAGASVGTSAGALAGAFVGAAAGELRVFKFAADADGLRALKREFTLFRVLKAELGDGPGFAQVIDANFAEAPYHLECAYGGPDLLAWAAEGGRLQAMSVAERLALFLPIAQAVAAAHSVGVLHKDLKPANVLIGGQAGAWLPVLTDFGSGHAIDPERLRQLGVTAMGLTLTHGVSADTTLGTAMYLAPEVQAGQASTVQSDLYALGLMLYQLLAGDLRRPMSTGWQRDIGDELLCEDITAATEGQPQARLGSVSALVERLANVEDRRAQRLRALAAEQRALAVAAEADQRRARRPWLVASIAILSLGLMASVWLGSRAESARQLAVAQSTRAQRINDFLNRDLLWSADITRAGNTKAVTMADVLMRASTRAGERFKDLPVVEASIRCQLGEAYLRGQATSSAVSELRRGTVLLARSAAPTDPELLACQFGLAQALAAADKGKEAESTLIAAELAGESLLHAGASGLTVSALRARLQVLTDSHRVALALPVAIRLVQAVDAWHGSDLTDRFDARQRLSEVYLLLEDLDRGVAVLDEITRPPYAPSSVGEVTFARARLGQAKVLQTQGKLDSARSVLEPLRDTLTKVLGPDAYLVGLANYELGNVYSLQSKGEESYDCLTLALAAFAASLGEEHGFSISIKANMAINDVLNGRSLKGLEAFNAITPWFRERGRSMAALDLHRARALNNLGRFAEAQALLSSPAAARSDWEYQNENDGTRWKVQAELGRALIGNGERAKGGLLIRSAVVELRKEGVTADVIQHYERHARH